MKLKIYSYTNRAGSQDTTINDGTNYLARLNNDDITAEGAAMRSQRGDGQSETLTGVRVKGRDLLITFKILGATVGDGFDFLGGLFDPRDTAQKKIVFKDLDDSNEQWSLTVRNGGVRPTQGGGVVEAKLICVSDVLVQETQQVESTWSITASGQTQAFTIDYGNVDALPTYEVTPTADRGYGQRYFRFCTVYNYTKLAASRHHVDITDGGLNTAALINFTSISLLLNAGAGVNASVTTIPYDTPTGSMPTVFPYMLYWGTEQMRVTARTGTSSGNLTVVRGINGTTAASHADNAVMALSKMAANGSDVRVLVADGNSNISEAPFWFGDSGTAVINSTATKIWVPLNIAARAIGTIATSITNSDTSLTLDTSEGIIDATYGLLLLESEIASYTSYRASNKTFLELSRGEIGSSAASHAAGVTVRALNDIRLYYGSATATAPSYSAALKPSFDLATSTNASWVYTSFASAIQNTINEWKASKTGVRTLNYSSDRDLNNIAPVDPVVELGVSTVNKAEIAQWALHVPFGFTSATFTNNDRYNLPANTGYLKASDGTQAAVAKTTAANTWQTTASQTLTPAATSFDLTYYIKNSTTANFVTRAAMNVAGVTVTLSTAGTATEGRPSISLGAEQAVTYDMDMVLANTTTGDSIHVVVDNVPIGTPVIINTLLRQVTLLNRRIDNAIRPSPVREHILRMAPGSNTLSYTETGATGVNVVVKWYGRNNALG